ncbi:hypothetical protein AAG906_013122 [Vitis piasezkii]
MGKVGKLKHENLVLLLGYCIFQDEKFLVYECMENGSLDVWLRNRTDAVEAMDWPTRFKIYLGSARGRFSASWHFVLWYIGCILVEYRHTMVARLPKNGEVCNFGVVIRVVRKGTNNGCKWEEDDEQDPYFSTIKMWKDEMLCGEAISGDKVGNSDKISKCSITWLSNFALDYLTLKTKILLRSREEAEIELGKDSKCALEDEGGKLKVKGNEEMAVLCMCKCGLYLGWAWVVLMSVLKVCDRWHWRLVRDRKDA